MSKQIHDYAEREMALNPSKSFIVQAPAGSGKTELLIQRYLTLLTTVDKPEEILSITFTKKAAHEMRSRLIKAIRSACNDPEPASDHAKKTWNLANKVLSRDKKLKWHLLENPNQLRIQTIDSFCSTLTKQLPLLSNFGAQPEISQQPNELYHAAVYEVLQHLEADYAWSPAIAMLLAHIDNDLNKLLELLVSMLQKRDQWLPYIHLDQNSNIKVELEEHIKAVIESHLSQIHTYLPTNLADELYSLARFAASNIATEDKNSDIKYCQDLSHLSPHYQDLGKWRGICQLLLTEDNWRKAVNKSVGFPAPTSSENKEEKALYKENKARMQSLLEKLEPYKAFKASLAELKMMPDAVYSNEQWLILSALFQVLKVLSAQLRVIFQQNKQIDYIENSQAALLALGDEDSPTDLALALDYQIKHILVDEFQDTSITQYRLLEKLVTGWSQDDNKTLFIVGDPMQSIYRFREAEVGIFIRMHEHGIAGLRLIPVKLSVNFRSTNEIVNWNNQCFTKIFPVFNDVANGAVSYNPSTTLENQQNNDSYIHIKAYKNNKKLKQAEDIAATIKSIREKHPGESIAILVRSRSMLANIIPQLKTENITYQAVDIDPLSSRQTIQDLFSLTRALLNTADRVAWLAILRAPWCGLSLNDLYIIAGNKSNNDIVNRLSSSKVILELSQNGQQRIKRISSFLTSAISQRQRFPLREWIENTWIQIGGPACLANAGEIDDVDTYFSLLDKLGGNHTHLSLEVLERHLERLFAHGQTTDENAVSIMTIHNAKGLEFDTVILPHLEAKTPADDKKILLWMDRPLPDDRTALLLAPISPTGQDEGKLYQYIQRQLKLKLDYEVDRLLYVATTRAKKRLILSFDLTEKENGEPQIDSGSFLSKCIDVFKSDNNFKIIESEINLNSPSEESKRGKFIKRVISNWQNPVTMPNLRLQATKHQSAPGFIRENWYKKVMGIIIHRILQQLSIAGLGWWESLPDENKRTYIIKLLQINHVYLNLNDHSKHILTIINNCMNSNEVKWIFASHSQAKSEYALTFNHNGITKNIVIDRTFVDKTDSRWIIDYKTTTPNPSESMSSFFSRQQENHKDQLNLYAAAMQKMDNRAIKLALFFPLIPAWQQIDEII